MPKHDSMTAGSNGIKRWLPLAVLAALMAMVFAMGWHKYLSFRTIGLNYDVLQAFIGQNFIAALALYMAIYIAVVALSLPGGLVMTLSGGLLFGFGAALTRGCAGRLTVLAAAVASLA